MVKYYIYLFGPEGSGYKDLRIIEGSLSQIKRNFVGPHFNNGYTLGWLVDRKHLEPFKKKSFSHIDDKYDLLAFFQSLKLSELGRFNYSCRKIHGFCDIVAPSRNSGILKKWYEKWKAKI